MSHSFPVYYGDKVTITCIDKYTLHGDSVLTCVKGREFLFENTPYCIVGKLCYLGIHSVSESPSSKVKQRTKYLNCQVYFSAMFMS